MCERGLKLLHICSVLMISFLSRPWLRDGVDAGVGAGVGVCE